MIKNIAVIGLLLIASRTAYCQDSTRLVSVPKYKLDRLLQAYFYKLPLADTLIKKQQIELEAYSLTLQALKKVDSLCEVRLANRIMAVKVLSDKAVNLDALHESQLKNEKKKGFKWGAIITGTGFTILDILLILALL